MCPFHLNVKFIGIKFFITSYYPFNVCSTYNDVILSFLMLAIGLSTILSILLKIQLLHSLFSLFFKFYVCFIFLYFMSAFIFIIISFLLLIFKLKSINTKSCFLLTLHLSYKFLAVFKYQFFCIFTIDSTDIL